MNKQQLRKALEKAGYDIRESMQNSEVRIFKVLKDNEVYLIHERNNFVMCYKFDQELNILDSSL